MIDKDKIIKQLTSPRVHDYSFVVLFFFIFSFFVYFAIRPNLSAVVSLRQEVRQLRELDTRYEANITKIVQLQTAIERSRGDVALLQEAVPPGPEVYKLVDDIKNGAARSNTTIQTLSVNDVPIKSPTATDSAQTYTVAIEIDGSFDRAQEFIEELFRQRRLKTIRNLSMIKQDQIGTGGARLKISVDIDGYYL